MPSARSSVPTALLSLAGGVIPFAQWVEQMRMDDPAWSNQECTDCSLNPGDPAPSPPVPPFNADGTVSCPAS